MLWSIPSGRHHKAWKLPSARLDQFDGFKGQKCSHAMAVQNIFFARRVDFLESKSCTFLDRFGVFLVRSLAATRYFHRDNTAGIVRKNVDIRTIVRCATAPIRK